MKNSFSGDQRLNVCKEFRMFVSEVLSSENDFLGFKDGSISATETYLIAVSLGMNQPMELPSTESYVRYATLKAEDRALLGSVLLGTATDDDEVKEFADETAVFSYCDKCAMRGYELLKEYIADSNNNNEILEMRLLQMLDDTYRSQVVANLL